MVPNGIDIEEFRVCAEFRHRIRAEWGLSEDTRLIGFVARLDPIKDHSTFIAAVSRMVKKSADVKFVCVGDGTPEYRRWLIKKAQVHGVHDNIIWVGERQDMPAVYNAFDVVTLVSESEGFPNVVGEGMACGVPCVATSVGDVSRIIGELGLIVPPHDPMALCEGWLQMLDRVEKDPGLRMRVRKRIVKQFNTHTLVEMTSAILRRLVD